MHRYSSTVGSEQVGSTKKKGYPRYRDASNGTHTKVQLHWKLDFYIGMYVLLYLLYSTYTHVAGQSFIGRPGSGHEPDSALGIFWLPGITYIPDIKFVATGQ